MSSQTGPPARDPEPALDPALVAYLDDLRLLNWAAAPHFGENSYAARAYAKLRAHFRGV